MLNSYFRPLCPAVLPYAERQRYMIEYDLANGQMPDEFSDYAKPVSDLCRAAGANRGTAFITIDEKLVQPGRSQRKPGPHVDGQFIKSKMAWDNTPPSWNHYCNNVPVARMPIIITANAVGARAWNGVFDAQPNEHGDLSHIAADLGEGEILKPDLGYLLSPDCVHESLIQQTAIRRSFLRIALPVGFAF